MTLTLPHYEPTGSVVALLSATSHQGNPDSSVAALLSGTSHQGNPDSSVAALLSATSHQGNPDRKFKLWNIVLTERYILHIQVLLEFCYI